MRLQDRLSTRELLAALITGGSFLAVALALALVLPSERQPSAWTMGVFLVVYALVSRLDYEIGTGSVVPTELILVPMLFVLPLGQVPLFVALGLMLGSVADWALGRVRFERVLLRLSDSWHVIGPVTVLALAGSPSPSLNDVPLYVLALAAQIAVEFGSFVVRDAISLGLDLRGELRASYQTAAIDLGLAPIGLAIAFPAQENTLAILLALPPILLLRLFATERSARIDSTLQLGEAYRGTALLLGDVIEADDAYTAAHSHDVVELSVAVARTARVEPGDRAVVELVALLHDVGKVRIPNEIIRKPGPLTADERAIVERHTIDGEQMLKQVGGLLATVGTLVRSCHERWDGTGYPDGLSGEEIPLISRIVCACDAYSAMTTDRPYRDALSVDEAIDELRLHAGTQFDPAVVEALTALITDGHAALR